MRVDTGTLAFGYIVKSGGGTPNWATALGQGKEYKINDTEGIDEILKGMIYSSVSLGDVSSKIGKGGRTVKGDDVDSPITNAAVFSKVYVNDYLIDSGKFVLLITRDDSQSHAGRLRLKYGPSNTWNDESGAIYTNDMFFERVKEQFGMADDACWFVTDISVVNQNELHFTAIIVNKDGSVEYDDSAALHQAWKDLDPFYANRVTGGKNVLFYGVPGAGKSYKIATEYCNNPRFMQRVVFHPDYTYSDFIGQILPTLNKDTDKLEYRFTKGPFTQILKKAEQDPGNMYYLIIEEINRGNAPAIFGDVFQLLDRYTIDSKEVKKNPKLLGESEYGITNFDIALEVYGDADYKVKIPSNLSILATMNTADQNVFTLDTAFQRRWELEHIKNDFSKAEHRNEKICDSDITWRAFADVTNEQIVSDSGFMGNSGDKRLGAYFARLSELQDNKKFSEKVLKYLWDDAVKMNHGKIFDVTYATSDEMIDAFEIKNGNDAFRAVLNPNVYDEMLSRVAIYAKAMTQGQQSQNDSDNEEDN